MKKILLIATLFSSVFISCSNQPPVSAQNNVVIQANEIPIGFNVQNLATLLKTTKDPQGLEQGINAQGNNINNLDLNGDGNIDYLQVIESSGNNLKIVDAVNPAQTDTIVQNITITKSVNNQVAVNVVGNQNYCGQNYNYNYSYPIGEMLFFSYMMYPHPYYYHPYRYGYYPVYYHPYHSVYRNAYRSSYRRDGVGVSRTYSSPRVSAPVRSSVSSPISSQRSFSTTNNSGGMRTTGFGHSSSSSSRSFGGGSRSFGGGHSSFGKRR